MSKYPFEIENCVVIEGEFIHLREGTQKLISAETTGLAKVAAAAAVSAPYSPLLPAVAVAPAAQNHRLKRVPSIYPKHKKAYLSAVVAIVVNHSDVPDKHLQISTMHDPYSNGVCYDNVHGLSNVGKQGKIFWGTKFLPIYTYDGWQ